MASTATAMMVSTIDIPSMPDDANLSLLRNLVCEVLDRVRMEVTIVWTIGEHQITLYEIAIRFRTSPGTTKIHESVPQRSLQILRKIIFIKIWALALTPI